MATNGDLPEFVKQKSPTQQKRREIFHQISLGRKNLAPKDSPQEKLFFLVTVGTLKKPPKKMLTNYDVPIETWACPKNFTYTPETNMDTQKDGLEKVVPFKYGHFWYLC